MSPLPHAPTELTSDDGSLRAQYLAEVLDLLYPGASAPVQAKPSAADPNTDVIARYIVIPDARRARLLVPAGNRRIAAAAVARYAEVTSRASQLKRQAVILALRTGADRFLLRDRVNVSVPHQQAVDSIDTYLARMLGRPLAVSVHIGPARANRKPVLQLLAPDGATVGFGKLGVSTLTRRLVRAETEALTTLGAAGLQSVSVPQVLHAGGWRGNEVLIQSALPIWAARTTLSTKRLAAGMREVAYCLGVESGPLASGQYWKALRARLDALTAASAARQLRVDGSDPTAEARALAMASEKLVDGAGAISLGYGAWHGDWTPWNMATTASSLLVWDWERFTAGVPLGYDALHFDFQRLLVHGVDAEKAVDITLGRVNRLLRPFDVAPAAANLTALLYLIDLATRYLEDRQAEAGAHLGVLGRWLLPILTRKVSAL
jgi:hypothetical protein